MRRIQQIHHWWRAKRAALLLAVWGVLATACVPAVPTPQQPMPGGFAPVTSADGSIRTHGRLLSTAETNDGLYFSRDCGYSRALSASETLWVFCDTLSGEADGRGSWRPGPVSFHGTMALSTTNGLEPGVLRELPRPFEFALPRGQVCPAHADTPYVLRWPAGLGPVRADGTLIVFFIDSCHIGGEITQLRWGGVVFDPATLSFSQESFVFRNDRTGIIRPLIMTSPTPHGGFLYFTSPRWRGQAHKLGNYRTGLARVPINQWKRWQAYQWWDGSRWQSKPARVAPLGLDKNQFQVGMDVMPGNRSSLMLVSQQLAERGRFGGRISIYDLPNPARPQLRLLVENTDVPGCNVSCYHIIPHPEYGTNQRAVFSYFNTEDILPVGQDWQFPPYGHTHSFDINLPTKPTRPKRR